MRGRKPKAERLRLLESDRARVVGGLELPTRPSWLDGDAAGEWDRVIAELSASYLVTPLDAMSLAAYCRAYAEWRRADDEVKAVGFTVPTKEGIKTNPTVRVWMSLLAELRRMAAEFGFSPAARSRIDVPRPDGEEEDDFEQFQNASS